MLFSYRIALLLFLAFFFTAYSEPVRPEDTSNSKIQYVDVAAQWGFVRPNTYGGRDHKTFILETTGNGAAIFDLDGDGWNDVLITNGTTLDADANTSSLSHLYRNNGAGRFVEVAEQAGMLKAGWAQGVCVGDYDNDGRPDLFVAYYGHNVLYRNEGAGKLRDVTAQAKLPTGGTRWGAGCSFVDYDRDGWLDLFVSNYVDLDLKRTPKPGENPNCSWKGLPVMCGPRGLPPGKNVLYHNNQDGTFTDVSREAGILKPGGRYGLGVIVSDFDNDGWPDIYVACDQTPSLLYRNRGDGTFEERGAAAGVAYNFDGRVQAGMGVAAGDYDGNGFFDVVKTNFSGEPSSLYKNEDGRFFTDVSREAGLSVNQLLGWGVVFVDADEDGWKDILMANGHVYPEVEKAAVGDRYLQKTLLYRNLGNGRFADVTPQSGRALLQLRAARGMAAGDLDGDGHPEIVIVNMNDRPAVLKNEGAHQNAIMVGVIGTKSNRSGIGARLTVEAGGMRQMDEVRSGGSFFSHNDMRLYFGLAHAEVVDRLQIRWPSGRIQEWRELPVNRRFVFSEGSQEVRSEGLSRQGISR
ncbi:MAG TPA: CRTAC1 family protein [Acidobacteriota bacterium]|jgi:hypothetical protein